MIAATIALALVAVAAFFVLLHRWRRLRIASEALLKVQEERRARSAAEGHAAAAEAKAVRAEREAQTLRHELGRREEVQHVREAVDAHVPPDAAVAVVSRGDDDLVALGSRPAGHFPQTEDGRYRGYHPASSADAIAHLEELRAGGTGYFVIPGSAFWWLEHYAELVRHLQRYTLVADEGDTCLIFHLDAAGAPSGSDDLAQHS